MVIIRINLVYVSAALVIYYVLSDLRYLSSGPLSKSAFEYWRNASSRAFYA